MENRPLATEEATGEQLRQEIARLQAENRRLTREARVMRSQIERYKTSVHSKEAMSKMISAEKERRDLFLHELLRVTPEIVLLLNDELDVVMCSKSYLAAAGMTSYDQIIGKPGIPDWLEYPEGQSQQTVHNELMETFLSKQFLEEEIYFTFITGTPKRYYKKYTLPICDDGGAPVGVILLFNDFTDLLAAKNYAEQASRAKSDFLANMSHEMRTPMNAVIGMTKIALDAEDAQRKDYCLGKINTASVHLLGVINDVLDMSKIEANKLVLAPEEFDLEKMLMKVAGVVGYSIEQKKQNFRVQLAPDIPRHIVSDDQRLSQVITNLLSNAIKFTPENGTITLRAEKLAQSGAMCTLRISVQDTGIGISDEEKGRLFRSFQQADDSTSRKYGGTGLGLAISKRIVEMLGGEIWVESTPGQGSSFFFTMRATVAENQGGPTPIAGINWDTLRVLAVDDAEDVREYFTSLSSSLHFHCDTAANGAAALQAMKQAKQPYNVIFVDMRMPEMDGIELTRRIRQLGPSGPVVIMISALEWSDIEAQANAAGVDSFISKPLFPSAIVDSITRCMGPRRCEPDEGAQPQSLDLTGKRILLAEDIEINREIVLTLLEPSGLAIDCAENGDIAVEMFQRNPTRYDMIFMDIHMPEKDGYQATREIRALEHPHAKSVPILAMTANVFREDVEKCLNAGMNDHVGKPLDMDEVERKLARYLRPVKKAATSIT